MKIIETLEDAGWRVHRFGRNVPVSETVSTYRFFHKATGRVVSFDVKETITANDYRELHFSGYDVALLNMIEHLDACEKANR